MNRKVHWDGKNLVRVSHLADFSDCETKNKVHPLVSHFFVLDKLIQNLINNMFRKTHTKTEVSAPRNFEVCTMDCFSLAEITICPQKDEHPNKDFT